jgi:ribonuclease E
MVVLLSDDSLIAPEYKVDRVGWQGKVQTKQPSRQSQKPSHANNNFNQDTGDSDKVEVADTEVNTAPHPENDETSSDDGGAKRRRRGRRGGRRRRRRNSEDGQTADNQAESSSNEEDQAAASTNTTTDGVAADDGAAPKARTGRGRGRRVARADPSATENTPEDNANANNKALAATAEPASNGSVNTAAADDNGDVAAAKKPAQRRKKPAAAPKADNAKAEDSKAEANSSPEKPLKKPARIRKPKAKSDAGDKPEQDAAAAKPAAKKPARKAAKKAPVKTADANNAGTSVNNGAPTDAPASREPISSAPQNVVEIGSNEPKSRRSGWWSRS